MDIVAIVNIQVSFQTAKTSVRTSFTRLKILPTFYSLPTFKMGFFIFRPKIDEKIGKKLIFAQKNWADAHFWEQKLGRKNRKKWLKMGKKGRFWGVFGLFLWIFKFLPTLPTFFYINCEKK